MREYFPSAYNILIHARNIHIHFRTPDKNRIKKETRKKRKEKMTKIDGMRIFSNKGLIIL